MDARAGDDRRSRQLRGLTEIGRALTWATSLDEVLRMTVERSAELLDADRAALLGADENGLLTVRAARGVPRDDAQAFREPLDERLSTRLGALLGAEPGRFVAVPLVVGGRINGILAVAVDTGDGDTEQEWLLSALADQAAVAIERTRLDETFGFRERLMAIVSHDLRNPINAISNAAETLLARDDVDERTTLVAATIRSSAARATRMIADLVDYTQARMSGGIPVRRQPADLLSIVRQALEEAKFMHPNRRVELIAIGSCDGSWDRDRVAQVVANLVANALSYSPSTGAVRVELSGETDSVRLAVQNEGPPIPAERLARIFEPVHRPATDGAILSRGVGLGLYIVRSVVDAHGGDVTVRSTSQDGTRFEVRLPREPAD